MNLKLTPFSDILIRRHITVCTGESTFFYAQSEYNKFSCVITPGIISKKKDKTVTYYIDEFLFVKFSGR